MKVGFIGTGSMGKILIEAFLKSGALEPADIVIHNRTRRKAELLAEHYPGMRVAEHNVDLVKDSEIIFICVKPLEYATVLNEIKEHVCSNHLVVTITSPVTVRDIEARTVGKVAKIVPSITNSVLSGASLFVYGSRLSASDRQRLYDLLARISRPVEINEQHVRVSSDLASCAPAFLSFMMQRFVHAATDVTDIPEETAVSLVNEMILGVGKLLTEGGYTLETLQERVAVPGGVTQDGLNLLERESGNVFNELLQLTQNKHTTDLRHVQHMFSEQT